MKLKYLLISSFLLLSQIAWTQGNSLNFDGTDDYVQTTYGGISGNAARTVEAWVKTSFIGTQKVIADWGNMTPNGSRFTLNMINGNLRIEVGGNGMNSTMPIADGNWHHVAIVYDNGLATGKHKLYIDGVFNIEGNLTVAVNTSTANDFVIGRRVDGNNSWNGNIDEVRVWNVARTAAELSANMNTELSGNEAGLMFYSKFDETQASCDIVDCSSGQNHGTRIGAAGANNLPQFSTDAPTLTDVACGVTLTNCTLPPPPCSMTGITLANISACNDNGTSADPSDDTFTADVTVNFSGAPATGTLDLSGDGTASVAVGSIGASSHVFTSVTMSADGTAISLTAAFSADAGCTVTNTNAGTAPNSCSVVVGSCVITSISTANISACDDGGTDNVAIDDTFTADITVNFANPPGTGTLDLVGDATASVAVGSLGAGTYTFTGVTMTANGGGISVTATFSDDGTCTFTNINAGTAPDSCSPLTPAIPTMSEWGLILFALIMFTISVVFGTQYQRVMAMSSTSGQVSTSIRQKFPFDKALYFSVLPLVYLVFAIIFAAAILLFGYELTSADVPGSLLSGAVIAYLIQFVRKSASK